MITTRDTPAPCWVVRLASVMGKSVLVIESRDHIGGKYVDKETAASTANC